MKQRVAVAFQSHQSSEHFSIKKGCLCWKVKESQTSVAQACIELHRPCFRRSEAKQRDWSHFRYGKVNPGCYIFPAHSESDGWKLLPSALFCPWWKFLDTNIYGTSDSYISPPVGNKWVPLRLNWRSGERLHVVLFLVGKIWKTHPAVVCSGRST